MLYMQLTHKNTYSFSGCYCSVFVSLFLSPISLVHLCFFMVLFFVFSARKKIQKVLKIMHINFLMCWFCLCFLADLHPCVLCLFPLDLKFPMQTTWREFGSLCWIFIPCCVLTGDAVKSTAIINRWIWIIPCEPDSHSATPSKNANLWRTLACLCCAAGSSGSSSAGRCFTVFPWPPNPINNPPLLVTGEGPCLPPPAVTTRKALEWATLPACNQHTPAADAMWWMAFPFR